MRTSPIALAKTSAASLFAGLLLTACGSGSGGSNTTSTTQDPAETADPQTPTVLTVQDQQLQALITQQNLDQSATDNRTIPDIDSDIAQLGKALFFSKSLGGDFDSACVTCHHPMLGGADQLSLPVGVGAIAPDVLGPGRVHTSGLPEVPRNSPTVFNVALWDDSLFWDSRVESLGKEANANGAVSGIRTPDSPYLQADANAGDNLAAAQARFPVTSAEEMRGTTFESGNSNTAVRDHLAARIGNYGDGQGELARNEWLALFQQAFAQNESAENLITFDNIAFAIGEYERSMVFINSPWRNYLEGDTSALSDAEKRGALLFFNTPQQGGAGCSACHNGPLLSDEQHHVVAFPQIGPGKGDGANSVSSINNSDDFGRERETGNSDDRYRFRTPSLLNIAQTAPYGHTGAFADLEQVVRHYVNPRASVEAYFRDNRQCDLQQFRDISNCQDLYLESLSHSLAAADKLDNERNNGSSQLPRIRLNNQDVSDLVAFLEALTDPCIEDRDCMSDWIADDATDRFENPDDQLLIGRDGNNNLL